MSTTFLKHFDLVADPRIERCKKHNLLDIILLSISAVLSGAQGWEDIEDFGHLKLDWLKKYRPFKYGIPKHDTIARVICRLKADEIEHAFQSWVSSLVEVTGCDVIAIDGKTAIPELLNMLDIENSIITLDAMGCQKAIAKQIIKQKADYILALKGNNSGMQAELEAWWHKSEREGLSVSHYVKYTDVDSGHGRIETRTCHQLLIDKSWLGKAYQWSGLKSIIKVHARIHDKSAGTDTEETRWYISSLNLNAEQALHAVRSHWQVESMHWMLDMTLREDGSRIRKKQGPLVFNVMRKIAMALFKRDEKKTASMARKKKMAGLDDDYRSTLLESGIKMR